MVSSEGAGLGHQRHLARLQQLQANPLNFSIPLILPRMDRNWFSLDFSCSFSASWVWNKRNKIQRSWTYLQREKLREDFLKFYLPTRPASFKTTDIEVKTVLWKYIFLDIVIKSRDSDYVNTRPVVLTSASGKLILG